MIKYLSIIFLIYFSSNYVLGQHLKVNIVNEEQLQVSKDKFIDIANEIFRYECARIRYYEDISITIKIEKLDYDRRGMTISDSMLICLAKDSVKKVSVLKGVFAHELGHIIYENILRPKYYGNNRFWEEGYVSWIAGKYYLGWQGYKNYQEAINKIAKKTKVNLRNGDYYSGSASERDLIYMSWACFIDYLIKNGGIEKSIELSKLFNSKHISGDLDTLFTIKQSFSLTEMEEIKIKQSKIEKEFIRNVLEKPFIKLYKKSFEELQDEWKKYNAI